MNRDDFGNAFECDPFLTRDIWIMNTMLDDWRRVYDVLRATYPLKYVVNKEVVPLPDDISAAFERQYVIDFKNLYVTVGSITLRSFFPGEGVINFCFDQCEIKTEEQLQPFLAFIELLARTVNKEVICSEELYPAVIYFRFNPAIGQYKVYSANRQ
jgi:hypothetical protein